MRMRLPLLGLFCASVASAIQITAPAANTTVAAGSTTLIQWSTVDTDPSTFSIYLVNFVDWPPSYVPLALDVPTSHESFAVQIPCDTRPSWGYQINAINGTNVYVIYAQSGKFAVSPALDPAGCVDSGAPATTTTTTPITPSCRAASPTTVFVTVSKTGLPRSDSTTTIIPTSTSSVSSTSSPDKNHPHYTKPGIVPKTIGWCSGYESPVTLDHPPTPAPAPGDNDNNDDDDLGTGAVTPAPVVNELSPAQPTDLGVSYITTWVTVAC